jgi:hypothetical protein
MAYVTAMLATDNATVKERVRAPGGTQRRHLDACLSDLNFRRDLRIHQGCATLRINDLSRDPAGLVRTEERNYVPDVFWDFRARVADEDIEASTRVPTCHIGLHEDTIGPTFPDLRERLFRGRLVLVIVDREP